MPVSFEHTQMSAVFFTTSSPNLKPRISVSPPTRACPPSAFHISPSTPNKAFGIALVFLQNSPKGVPLNLKPWCLWRVNGKPFLGHQTTKALAMFEACPRLQGPPAVGVGWQLGCQVDQKVPDTMGFGGGTSKIRYFNHVGQVTHGQKLGAERRTV